MSETRFGFTKGQSIRFRPGKGTYGYEDSMGEDGRVPGVVDGFTPKRVRVELELSHGRKEKTAVDPGSLA